MKNPTFTLSITAILMTCIAFICPTSLQASFKGNPWGIENPFNLNLASGMSLKPETEGDDSLRQTHQEIIDMLREHFKRDTVYFNRVKKVNKITSEITEYAFEGGTLTDKSLSEKVNLCESMIDTNSSLQGYLNEWKFSLNTFVDGYTKYVSEKRDVTLLTTMNKLYTGRAYGFQRQYAVEDILDGSFSFQMNQIVTKTKENARSTQVPITRLFDPVRDDLWIQLVAMVVDDNTYPENSIIRKNVQKAIKRVKLDHIAFTAFHDGILFKESTLSTLLSTLQGEACRLPKFRYPKYQNLLCAEAGLLMVQFQQYLVHPNSIKELWKNNTSELLVQRKIYVNSDIEKVIRSRFVLANRLVPEALGRQNKLEADASKALGDLVAPELAKAWMIAESDEARTKVLSDAKVAKVINEKTEKKDGDEG